jgi:chromate transport protein ChrA
MHAELVEKKKWISEARFLHAHCMLLPGPEAQQLAIYVGWLLHKTWGGIVAGAFFIIPSIFILWALSYIYVAFGTIPWIAAIFYGLKPAVFAIVAAAVIRIGSRALKNEVMWTLSAAAFGAIFFLHAPFPLIISSAAAIGYLGGKWKRDKFLVIRGHGKANAESVLDDTSAVPDHAKPSWPRALWVALVWVILWLAPVLFADFLPWEQSHRGSRRDFFQQGRVGHLWWRLCRIALRGAAGRPNTSLALRRSDAGRAWACGNDSRSIDYGDPICRVSRRLESPGPVAADRCCRAGRLGHDLDDIYALLPMDLSWPPLH